MKISQLILDGWADLQRRRDNLHALRDRYHRAAEDAGRTFTHEYLSNPIFEANDDLHKRKVLRRLESLNVEQRTAAVSVALHAVETALRGFERELMAFKEAARQAPDPVSAWMELSGGRRELLKDETEMLAEVAHERVAEDQDLVWNAATTEETPTTPLEADVLAVSVVFGTTVGDDDRDILQRTLKLVRQIVER